VTTLSWKKMSCCLHIEPGQLVADKISLFKYI
jgi:hypothetical protein